MKLTEIYNEMKNLTVPKKEDTLFLTFLFLSMFFWSVDIASTRHMVWKYGIGIELDPRTVTLYGMVGDRTFDIAYGFYIGLHLFLWLLYRSFPINGWLFLMSFLAVTVYTNFSNFLVVGLV